MRVRIVFLLIVFSVSAVYSAKAAKAGAAAIAQPEEKTEPMAEIGLSTGQVIKGIIVRVGEKEIVYKDDPKSPEKSLPADAAIFIRSPAGEYRFIFPPETAEQAAATKNEPQNSEFIIIAGITGHFADNSATGDFTNEYANALAVQYNQQLNPKGFTARETREAAAVQWQFHAEPRLVYSQLMLGFSLGYAALPKTAALVSSSFYTGQLTLNVDGFFIPAVAMVYYRWVTGPDWGINLGAGAGVLYSSVHFTQNNGAASDYQIFTSYNPMLVFKPELTYRLGRFTLIAALPVYWAESRDLSDGDTTLSSVSKVNAISANLTGIGFSLSLGMNLF